MFLESLWHSRRKDHMFGTSLVVQWLRLCVGGTGLIPAQGTKIPYVTPHPPQKKEKKKEPQEQCPNLWLLWWTFDEVREIQIPIYSVSSDCVNMDKLFEFHDLHLGAGYGNKVYKTLWRMGIKFIKHLTRNTYSVHSNFTVFILSGCVWASGWCVVAKYYANNYWEIPLQVMGAPYRVWKLISVHTWVNRRDIVKPFFDNWPWVITWYKTITLEPRYKTAHRIGCKEGLGPWPKSF